MALTSGFFNSINEDRKYDALQMSSIFDGIIRDGIFMHYGTSMVVKASAGMQVIIGVGRAWFNHTWSLNDSLYPIMIDQSEVVLDRIDTVVLEIDSTLAVRTNSYKVIKGTPAANPVRPALIKSASFNQYPLCDVRVGRLVTTINQTNITNRVGTSDCPFVTGPLELMNVDALIAQWGEQWTHFYNGQVVYLTKTTEQLLAIWNDFYATQIADITGQNDSWRQQWITWYNTETTRATQEMDDWRENRETTFDNWRNNEQTDFYAWLNSLTLLLDGDIATNLASAVTNIERKLADLKEMTEQFKNTLSNEFMVLSAIKDSDGNTILDDSGNDIEGQVIFCIKPCGCAANL